MAGIGKAIAGDEEPQAGQDPQAGQEPGQAAPEGQQDDGDQANVSPEEQAAYDEFVTNGMKLIYQGDHVAPAILGQLKGDWKGVEDSLGEIPQEEKPLDPGNPIDDLSVATVSLVLALEASAANSGQKLDPAVIFHGGAELMEQLADIAQAANIHDFSEDEMTGAANRAALLYGVSSKSMDKQEALAEFDHFLKTQGDQLGQSLGAAAQQGGAEEQGEQQPDNEQEEQ
jgi:hypothetical protein